MKEKFPENFRLDFAVSREQQNEQGEKMYIQTRMAQYANELWELLKKDNTFVYMCGLKGMEKGIDDIMTSLAARDGNLKKTKGCMPLFLSEMLWCFCDSRVGIFMKSWGHFCKHFLLSTYSYTCTYVVYVIYTCIYSYTYSY